MHTFRITDEVVEVRSGILFRTHRNARLDRIQGINIIRPLFARLFGAAKLEIVGRRPATPTCSSSYLGSAARRRAARATSCASPRGARAEKAAEAADAAGGAPAVVAAPGQPGEPARRPRSPSSAVIGHRVDEFLAPELDPSLAPPESVVHLPLGRVIGSTLLGGSTVWAIILVAIIVVGVSTGRALGALLVRARRDRSR